MTDDEVVLPCPAPAHWWWTWVSGWLLLCCPLWLGVYSVGFFFFPLLIILPSWDSKTPHRLLWDAFPTVELLLLDPTWGWVSIQIFCLFFLSFILTNLLLKRMCCLSGSLESTACIQKCFCGSCSTFKWSFYKFVGEKFLYHFGTGSVSNFIDLSLLPVIFCLTNCLSVLFIFSKNQLLVLSLL